MDPARCGHVGRAVRHGPVEVRLDAGDGAPIAALVYDGAAQRLIYYIIDASGNFVGAATPNGSKGCRPGSQHLVEGGVRASGELVVGIDGAFFSYRQFAGSIDAGDGVTPFSVGDVSNGGEPFTGTIDSPFVTAAAAPDGDYTAPTTAPAAGAATLLLLPLDLSGEWTRRSADPGHWGPRFAE